MEQTSIQAAVEAAVKEAIKMTANRKVTLQEAQCLSAKIEEESSRRGQQSVIAVCGPDGHPILVHVMDGAFLVSYDVAVKKAYTAVAMKMSTMELSRLAQPGETFYGIDKMDDGKICILGGGVPLEIGDQIVGGLAVSGGTGEVDDDLAKYGAAVFENMMQNK